MKKMSYSLARSYSLTRRLGTRVHLAGKIIYLPNRKVPRVVQKLTLDQIAAIPRDRYSVKVIEPMEPSKVTSVSKRRRMQLLARRERLRFHGCCGRANSLKVLKVQTIPEEVSVETDRTKEYLTVIESLNLVIKETDRLYYENRELKRKLQIAPPEDSGIFFSPIDEGEMSDCIKKIILAFFGDNVIGKICGRIIKLVEFCLLMHCYFKYIHILKNKALKPFSDFLEKKVFPEESKFTARTFNNYANDPGFVKLENSFNDKTKPKINFNHHPIPTGTLQDVFHEIGWNFHHSPYFIKLREQKNNITGFDI